MANYIFRNLSLFCSIVPVRHSGNSANSCCDIARCIRWNFVFHTTTVEPHTGSTSELESFNAIVKLHVIDRHMNLEIFQVWFAAITQCFFSLAVCFGNLIMYASFNRFDHNVYKDATIVTSIDTFTSMLAGFTIFGIIGHLAHESGVTDIKDVVRGGAGLAFISYPDAIARFQFLPQVSIKLSMMA